MALADTLVRENETVAGKYLIGRTIGEGGMGVVVAARHLELDQMVAIKFLRPEIAKEGSSAERFRREARAAVKIRSEHVCRVLDVGTLQNGVPYLVMEYLEGCDLSDELSRRGRIPVDEAIDYVLQACEALAEAHAAGIVHRDLKPGNLFLEVRRDGTRGIKVLDFGVSKSILEGQGQLRLTKTASLVGSPLYMSPEQLDAAKDVDARADIWALSTILFELIAGRTPFAAETIPQLVHAVMSGQPPPFTELGIDVSPELEQALLMSLSKQRSERHQTVAELARALSPFGPAHSIVSVLRTERVLAATGGGSNPVPLGTASASGPWRTPNPAAEGNPDTVTTRTMDVSNPPPAGVGVTPGPWGHHTQEKPSGHLRRSVVMAFTILSVCTVALVIAVVLFWKDKPETTRQQTAAASGAAANPTPAPAAASPAPLATEMANAKPEPAVVPIATTTEPVQTAQPSASRDEAKTGLTASQVTFHPAPAKASAASTKASGAGSKATLATPSKSTGPSEGISDFGGRR